MKENNKGETDIYTIIVVVVTVLIIAVLAYLFYFFATKSASLASTGVAALNKSQNLNSTKVIYFKPSEVLPNNIKNGNCWTSSIAEPFRADAFRCTVSSAIYDPCFKTPEDGFVFCQMNPLIPESFLIKLTKSLPQIETTQNKQDNWAWFLKLRDGTYCSPFTGTRPFFGEKQIAYYGCVSSNNKAEQIVLMGDLIQGDIWTANKAFIIRQDKNWVVKSTEKVQIDTVWQ
jgi:hypothetical protein